jgi:hypothetical protein
MDSFDITCDGVLDLIISREDGLIEVNCSEIFNSNLFLIKEIKLNF